MPVPTTLPIMAGLSILGAALGVTLGKSAISEINPLYFNEAEDEFHADLVPYRSPDWAQVHQAEYRAAQQPVIVGELGGGCIGCRTYPVEYAPRHDPAVDRYAEGELLRAPEPTVVTVAQASAPDPARERIQAYASYPVSSEERPTQVAEAPTEATAEEAAAPTGL
ncbi:MAG TPA: hypothetical protein VFQ67_16275 [Allosphingosinicella sp.]|jgi:hypothetical protein|nr:hypothetical protein [Allosphingosinicella sp.]